MVDTSNVALVPWTITWRGFPSSIRDEGGKSADLLSPSLRLRMAARSHPSGTYVRGRRPPFYCSSPFPAVAAAAAAAMPISLSVTAAAATELTVWSFFALLRPIGLQSSFKESRPTAENSPKSATFDYQQETRRSRTDAAVASAAGVGSQVGGRAAPLAPSSPSAAKRLKS